jgi:hypothetical protein
MFASAGTCMIHGLAFSYGERRLARESDVPRKVRTKARKLHAILIEKVQNTQIEIAPSDLSRVEQSGGEYVSSAEVVCKFAASH